MQSIVIKGRSLNRRNDWRSPACVTKKKLVRFSCENNISKKNYNIKKMKKEEEKKKNICMDE